MQYKHNLLGMYPLALAGYPPTRVPRKVLHWEVSHWRRSTVKSLKEGVWWELLANECCWLVYTVGVKTEQLQALQERGAREGIHL